MHVAPRSVRYPWQVNPELARAESLIRSIPDYPQPGILFRDITPLLADARALHATTEALVEPFAGSFDVVAGVEARGFILAGAAAITAGVGFVPIRKAGKLPGATHRVSYDLEYGTAAVEVQVDAFHPAQRVLVMDDVLATGGTAEASCELVEQAGAEVVEVAMLLELSFLAGRARLPGRTVHSLLTV